MLRRSASRMPSPSPLPRYSRPASSNGGIDPTRALSADPLRLSWDGVQVFPRQIDTGVDPSDYRAGE